jgi:protein-S-isoprenylcysteine O-methyltransferase Ste14
MNNPNIPAPATEHLNLGGHECVIRRILAIVGSAIFLVLAPGFVAGMVPWWISHWRVEAALLGLPTLRFLGGVLLALGAVGILDSFGRFAIQGIGTPSPVFPTRHLVITGLYRYVRNPIYVAVVSTILGQGLLVVDLDHGLRTPCVTVTHLADVARLVYQLDGSRHAVSLR